MPEDRKTCEKCRYFVVYAKFPGRLDRLRGRTETVETSEGECQRFPPVAVGTAYWGCSKRAMSLFPGVAKDEWCGEFREEE